MLLQRSKIVVSFPATNRSMKEKMSAIHVITLHTFIHKPNTHTMVQVLSNRGRLIKTNEYGM